MVCNCMGDDCQVVVSFLLTTSSVMRQGGMIHHVWRLSEGGGNNLGPAVTSEGLFLGRTPLIERRDGRFVVRDWHDLERLLKRAYQSAPIANRLRPGLATAAAALNANDPCLARIAAVHLKIPDLTDRTARDGVEAEDLLIKYAHGEGGGYWNPALHPRTGAPPNPGWFAPTAGSSKSSPIRTAQNDDPAQRSGAPTGPDNGSSQVPVEPRAQLAVFPYDALVSPCFVSMGPGGCDGYGGPSRSTESDFVGGTGGTAVLEAQRRGRKTPP